jgi:peptidoglycan biosynthesis protein MviN/MurJ (putative lipid II flippase)
MTALTLLVWLGLLIILPGNFANTDFRQTAFRTLIVAFVVNVYLNLVSFYPSLLKYQAGSEAAVWINHNNSAKAACCTKLGGCQFPHGVLPEPTHYSG